MQFLFNCSPSDRPFLPLLKSFFNGHTVHLSDVSPTILYELTSVAKQKKLDAIITCNPTTLSKLINKTGSIDDYSGSLITVRDVKFLVAPLPEHIVTIPYGKHLYSRYISKLTDARSWFPQTNFTWELASESNVGDLFDLFSRANYIAVDIETNKELLAIECVGYCGIWFESGSYRTHVVVIPCNSNYFLTWIRKFNDLPAPKITQNGKYDNSYFLRFNAPLRAWYWDTINLFHSWYSELPKDLAFIVSYMLHTFQYWKSEIHGNLEEFYRYNARDAYGTAISFLALIAEMPEWATNNYLLEFPLVYPCLLSENTGIQVEKSRFLSTRSLLEEKMNEKLSSVRTMVGNSNYNPSSWQQTQKLFAALGSKDITSTGKVGRDKVAARHPLNKRIVTYAGKYREERKLATSYTKDSIFYPGSNNVLYQLNPHGTDTSRMASQEHHFWCGLQIQNIPRDKKEALSIKQMFCAPEGFYLGEADGEQAEARDTAYLSGDKNLIDVVESDKDFHAINVERFFGIPYNQIVSENGEVLNKDIRELSKRVNHGSNNNLTSWQKFIDILGIELVLNAQKLLKLDPTWTIRQVAEYLVHSYDRAYPTLRTDYYDYLVHTVESTRLLIGQTGWTRYCFGHPSKVKHHKSVYAAHPQQCLNAQWLNHSWKRIFYEIALANPMDFRLHAQIHDSVLFSYRSNRRDLAIKVRECMTHPMTIKDWKGIARTFTIPVALKGEAKYWNELKEME